MQRELINYDIGDPVKVREGVMDPQFENLNIGGWQGRVYSPPAEGEDGDGIVVGIKWDSITLREMPANIIEECNVEGYDWTINYLSIDELEPAIARDTEEDVEEAEEELSIKYKWATLGDQGKRIQKILEDVDPGDDMGAYEAWADYLEEKLTFPFDAKVIESDMGTVRVGTEVEVLAFNEIDQIYGILVDVKDNRTTFQLPLCDLVAEDETSPSYQPSRDYVVWYANK
jgi:hypothetical protein